MSRSRSWYTSCFAKTRLAKILVTCVEVVITCVLKVSLASLSPLPQLTDSDLFYKRAPPLRNRCLKQRRTITTTTLSSRLRLDIPMNSSNARIIDFGDLCDNRNARRVAHPIPSGPPFGPQYPHFSPAPSQSSRPEYAGSSNRLSSTSMAPNGLTPWDQYALPQHSLLYAAPSGLPMGTLDAQIVQEYDGRATYFPDVRFTR